MRFYAQHAAALKREVAATIPPDVLRDLHRKRPLRHALLTLRVFGLLAIAMVVLIHGAPLWLWLPAALVAGFCIFDGTVLLHEVVHNAVFHDDRPGGHRWLGYLYSIPSGISAAQFTKWHLDHHEELGSDELDPKRHRLSPKVNRRWYKLLYFSPALFFIYFRAARQETAGYPAALQKTIARERSIAILFHLSVMAAIGLLAGSHALLRAYIVPVFFVFPVAFAINRLGQHYDIDPNEVAEWSTLMKPSWVWDFAFLNSNYHLEHHYFPRVPSYNLPRLARALAPFYATRGMQTHTFGELLWKYLILNYQPHTDWDHPAAPMSRPAAVSGD